MSNFILRDSGVAGTYFNPAGRNISGRLSQTLDSLSRRESQQMQRDMLDEERSKKALVEDTAQIASLLDQSQPQQAAQLLQRRIQSGEKLGKDMSHTTSLLDQINSGDLEGARAQVQSVLDKASGMGYYTDPKLARAKVALSADRRTANERDWERYMEIRAKDPKLAQKFWDSVVTPKWVDTGSKFEKAGEGETAPIEKDLPPEKELDYISDAAAAAQTGKVEGEKAASAETAVNEAARALSLLNKAIEHPGREAATGMSSMFNFAAIPGTDRKDFLVLADQLKGQSFIEAYQGLKGGGQITEIEGLKAEQAQNRLNEAQGEEEYLRAIYEMETLIVQRLKKNAERGDVDLLKIFPVVNSQELYDSLPPGGFYLEDGELYQKPRN